MIYILLKTIHISVISINLFQLIAKASFLIFILLVLTYTKITKIKIIIIPVKICLKKNLQKYTIKIRLL